MAIFPAAELVKLSPVPFKVIPLEAVMAPLLVTVVVVPLLLLV